MRASLGADAWTGANHSLKAGRSCRRGWRDGWGCDVRLRRCSAERACAEKPTLQHDARARVHCRRACANAAPPLTLARRSSTEPIPADARKPRQTRGTASSLARARWHPEIEQLGHGHNPRGRGDTQPKTQPARPIETAPDALARRDEPTRMRSLVWTCAARCHCRDVECISDTQRVVPSLG